MNGSSDSENQPKRQRYFNSETKINHCSYNISILCLLTLLIYQITNSGSLLRASVGKYSKLYYLNSNPQSIVCG